MLPLLAGTVYEQLLRPLCRAPRDSRLDQIWKHVGALAPQSPNFNGGASRKMSDRIGWEVLERKAFGWFVFKNLGSWFHVGLPLTERGRLIFRTNHVDHF